MKEPGSWEIEKLQLCLHLHSPITPLLPTLPPPPTPLHTHTSTPAIPQVIISFTAPAPAASQKQMEELGSLSSESDHL